MAVGGPARSTLSLDALQIKENSEQLMVDGRILQRGTDYSIDYGTGLVTFTSPDALFGSGASQVTARFEALLEDVIPSDGGAPRGGRHVAGENAHRGALTGPV